MRIFKTLMVLMAAGGIFTANLASAAMPCKCDQPAMKTQDSADTAAAMPCHDTTATKDASVKADHCHNCKCLHGAAAMMLPVMQLAIPAIPPVVPILANHAMHVHAPEAMFQPPRSLS
jgi:hypothetical protein